MEAERFLNKFVKIVIDEGNATAVYSGKVLSVDSNSLTLRDKFNIELAVALDRIIKIEGRD